MKIGVPKIVSLSSKVTPSKGSFRISDILVPTINLSVNAILDKKQSYSFKSMLDWPQKYDAPTACTYQYCSADNTRTCTQVTLIRWNNFYVWVHKLFFIVSLIDFLGMPTFTIEKQHAHDIRTGYGAVVCREKIQIGSYHFLRLRVTFWN